MAPLAGFFLVLVWIGFVIYMAQLGARLVAAVEHIAKRMDQPPGTTEILGPHVIQ